MNVTVFGASAPQPGDPVYEQALCLGKRLAENGHSVLTGGYMGVMEAVSRGANEAGGHVIGVTCEEIETWRKRKPNQWVLEERRHRTLPERLAGLIDGCDAAVAAPGGIGTLAEIALIWNRLVVESISPRPLILLGPGWKRVLDVFLSEMDAFISQQDQQLLVCADDVEGVIQLLKR